MKKIFFFFVVIFSISVCAHGQKRISASAVEQIQKTLKDNPLLQDSDEDFKNTSATTDSRWQNESAVILSQRTSFSFDKQGVSAGKIVGRNILGLLFAPVTLGTSIAGVNKKNKNDIVVQEKERRKILLRDNFSIDQYSVLYFRLMQDGDAFAARVIKKNGDIENIDIAEAIGVTDASTIPDIFTGYTDSRPSRWGRTSYYKIPVINLEPGDIIEYEYQHMNTQTYYHNPDFKEFDPIYYSCNREIPVAKQAIEVVAENDNYYMAYKTLKGAPSFTTLSKDGKKIYRWSDNTYREKNTATTYVSKYLEMPTVKFQVLYARNNSKAYLWFENEDAMKNDLTTDALAAQAKTLWFQPAKLASTGTYMDGIEGSPDDYVKYLYKLMKKRQITDVSDDEYAQKAYYTIRSLTVRENWSDYAFAKIFSGLLAERKLDHEVVVTPYNTRTNIANLAFSNELGWAIKFKNKYYVNPDDNFNPGEIPAYLAGNDCINFSYANEKASYTKGTIPLGGPDDNTLAITVNASLEPQKKSNLSVERITAARNIVKNGMIEEAIAYTPYIESDFRNYDGDDMWEGLDEKTADARSEQFNKMKKEWKDKTKPEYMKSLVEDDFSYEVSSYDNFQMQNDGRSYRKQDLQYTEKFTLANVSSFAGDDILIGLPSLIGAQMRIEKKEQQSRTYSIDVNYARKLTWHIVMPVPAGYRAAGLENLSMNVSNNCGEFISSAKVENNSVVIDVKKVYKAKQFKAEDWQQLLDMLNAAYNFSQAKILLMKQ